MNEQNKDVQEYLNKLPQYIRENIAQSGVEITSVAQLEKIIKNIENK